MPRIYTKTGDDGTTGLLYGGRVSKADPVTEAYGTTDEAVAVLGLARSLCGRGRLAADLLTLQRELFVVGADLATNPQRAKLEPGVSLVSPEMVAGWSRGSTSSSLPTPAEGLHRPRREPRAATLDVARSTIRRAERQVVGLREPEARSTEGIPLPEPALGRDCSCSRARGGRDGADQPNRGAG